jgi:hypothetical protein
MKYKQRVCQWNYGSISEAFSLEPLNIGFALVGFCLQKRCHSRKIADAFTILELVFRALKYRLGRLRRVNIPGWSRRRPVDWARDEGHDRWLKYFQIPLKVFLTVLA